MASRALPLLRRPSATAGALACALALGAVAAAQDADHAKTPREGPAEQTTIYVPYKNMDEIFDKEKGGVFLPYSELMKLIARASRTPPAAEVAPPPPVPFVIVGARYKGVADERVARFSSVIDLEVLEKKGYVTIPLGLPDVALEDVKSSDAAGAPEARRQGEIKRVVVRAGPQDYELIAHGAGPLSIQAQFAARVNEDPGKRSFTFRLPRAAMSTFEVDLPERDVRVAVDGALAFSTSTPQDAPGKTRVTAFLGSVERTTVTWWPRPKEVEGERKSLIFAETATAVRLEEGVARSRSVISYKINQAPADTFRIAFPKDWKVLKVSGDNMNVWEVAAHDQNFQALKVVLHSKLKDAYRLELELERGVPDGAKEFAYPQIVTLETERESGVIAAASSPLLKLEAKAFTGLSQIDAKDIPPEIAGSLQGERPPLGFRYLKAGFGLSLEVSKIEPEVEGKVLELATVKDEEVAVVALIQYDIKRRGIFRVKLKLPPDLQLLECGDEQTVKDFTLGQPDKSGAVPLDVEFPRQVKGPYTLRLVGQIKRKDAAATAALALPLITLEDVKKETGIVAIAAQDHLKVLATKPDGLTSLAVLELPAQHFPHRAGQGEEMKLSWKYTRITDAKREPRLVAATLDVSKREPKVTCRVETIANAQENVVEVASEVIYKIEYAGVDTFRLRVPAALANEKDLAITDAEGRTTFSRALVREASPGVFEAVKADDPAARDAIAKAGAVWEVKLDKKIPPGELRLKLRYDVKLEGLQAGKERPVALHDIEPLGVFNETGDVALVKHENLVISEQEMQHLEVRDVSGLPESMKREKGVFKAYRYQSHPVKLELRVIKYDFQAPLGMIVNHLHLEEVVSKTGVIDVEAWVRLQNSQAQLIRIALPPGSKPQGLRVAERNVKWSSQGEKEEAGKAVVIVVNLAEERVRHEKPEPFLIRIRYQLDGRAALSGLGRVALEAPSFPIGEVDKKLIEVPVALFTRHTYLPDAFAYLDFDTDMTPHFVRRGAWEWLKGVVFVDLREREGAQNARAAIQQTMSMATGGVDPSGVYPRLELPSSQGKLLSKLDGHARLDVRYASWPLFYVLDVLALAAVVALGVFLERRAIMTPAAYVPTAGGAMLLLSAFGGLALQPFFDSGLVGAVGLGAFWVGRGVWRELTVERHRRRLEELAAEAQVARARAAAIEAEVRGPRPPSPTPPSEPKGPATDADAQAAASIRMDDAGTGTGTGTGTDAASGPARA